MAKITYLLGAGASFGERTEDGNIVRGVPIVSEFRKAISRLNTLLGGNNRDASDLRKMRLYDELKWLGDNCDSYPTIDTYAKMLFVTKRSEEYERIKRTLTLFLLLHQINTPRDLRYDGFIASLLDQNGNFPNIDILTWNYDSQFEIAYADYSKRGKYISDLWNELNVINKTVETGKAYGTGFSITKLNGTALFVDKDGNKIIDLFNGGYKNDRELWTEIDRILNYSTLYQNTLSYAWERNNDFVAKVAERVKNTSSLVVIGYSFPYVNREIDRTIIQNMHLLERIYIQDPYANEIKESVEAILSDKVRKVNIITKTNTKQFFIPNEL